MTEKAVASLLGTGAARADFWTGSVLPLDWGPRAAETTGPLRLSLSISWAELPKGQRVQEESPDRGDQGLPVLRASQSPLTACMGLGGNRLHPGLALIRVQERNQRETEQEAGEWMRRSCPCQSETPNQNPTDKGT